MYRYVAFAWDPRNLADTQRVRDMQRRIPALIPDARQILKCAGLSVHAASDSRASFETYRTGDDDVLVLGKLFHKPDEDGIAAPVQALDAQSVRSIRESRGRTLLERYWGGYVAFIHDDTHNTTRVVRDPSAEVPAFVTRIGTLSLVFSCMEDCLALSGARFSIDWQYIAGFLLRPYIQVCRTGLREVSLVAPGECLELQGGKERARQYYWDIAGIACQDPIEDVDAAATSARRVIRASVGALADAHPQIILRLSGGLDSSCVLAALMHAPSRPHITCVHHYDQFAGADERYFARLAVDGTTAATGRSCILIEQERIPSELRFDRAEAFPRTALPAHYAGYLTERHIGPEATPNGQSIQFTGHGGDGIFGRLDHEFSAIDYVWRHGLGRHLPRIAFEASQGGLTFYGALARALQRGLVRHRPALNNFKSTSMINPDVIAGAHRDEANLVPAWRRASAHDHRLSPEKRLHIELMSLPWKLLDPHERVGKWDWIAPLTAQPIMELFARMPLYVLMADAEERTIARRAFAPDLPPRLIARRTKSYLNGYVFAAVQQHEDYLREMFCDGVLAREGILDRRIVENTLRTMGTEATPLIRDLIGPQLNAEIWLRNWLKSAGAAAATSHAAQAIRVNSPNAARELPLAHRT